MKNNELQTIVGSGGIIGNGLSTALREYTSKVRLVGRNPSKVNSDDELYPADALNFKAISEAVKGSKVVYLTLGLPYSVKVWQRDWPVVMDNVIKACQEHGARLVFFDNVYMYGLVKGAMTEETPVNPCSRKGEVRAQIADKLLHEIKHNRFEALIARSADFYGPGAVNTFVHPMVFEKLKAGKKASWLGNDQVKHAFTFTTDAIKGTALLGNTNKAFGQVWHLPTHAAALTGKEFIEEVGAEFSIRPKHSVLTNWMMKMAGLFNPMARESAEMMYQYNHEYLVSSGKFEKSFFAPTSYREGISISAKYIS